MGSCHGVHQRRAPLKKTCPRLSHSGAKHFQKLWEWLKFWEKKRTPLKPFRVMRATFSDAVPWKDLGVSLLPGEARRETGLLSSRSMLNEWKIKCQFSSSSQCVIAFVFFWQVQFCFLLSFLLSVQKTSVSSSVDTNSGKTPLGFEKTVSRGALTKQGAISDRTAASSRHNFVFFFSWLLYLHPRNWIDKRAVPKSITAFILKRESLTLLEQC